MIKKGLIGDTLVFTLFLIIYLVTFSQNFSLALFMVLLIFSLFTRNRLTSIFPKWSNSAAKKKIEYSILTFFIIVIGNGLYAADVSVPVSFVILFLVYEMNKHIVYAMKDHSQNQHMEN